MRAVHWPASFALENLMKFIYVMAMLLCAFSYAGNASELKVVIEAEQENWWKIDKVELGPGLGHLMRPDLHAKVEIGYTIQSDGTPSDLTIISKSDPSLADELLFELVRLNHYAPTKTNKERIAIRTSGTFELGGSKVPAPKSRSPKLQESNVVFPGAQ